MRSIDLRSDTVTKPTREMRDAMAAADVGDDVMGEDPTVKRLERVAAEKLGKEAALFVPSGTMANQIAIFTHTRRIGEAIVEAESHLYYYEAGAMSQLSGVQARPLKGRLGMLDVEELRGAIRPNEQHHPPTTLIALENTHNRHGGAALTARYTDQIAEVSHANRIPLHLDGARIFNAAIALKTDAKKLAAPADSVMFCISKGLCAPIGSLLCGSQGFIERARMTRKMFGGGMRQAGIIAAAGLVALDSMVDRLADDHGNAAILARGIESTPGLRLAYPQQTNIVIFDVAGAGISSQALVHEAKKEDLLVSPRTPTYVRAVTHHDVTQADVETAVEILKTCVKRLSTGS
jgi:threonine aldolase